MRGRSIQVASKVPKKAKDFIDRVVGDGGVTSTYREIKDGLYPLDRRGFVEKSSFLLTPDGFREDVVPAIVPNLASGDLTYTRADTNGTVVNKDGYIENACYNLLAYSKAHNTALSWYLAGQGAGTSPTMTVNAAIAPDGTMTATRLQCNQGALGGGNRSRLQQSKTLIINNVYTLSVWVKSATGANQPFSILENTLSPLSGETSQKTATNEWQRVSFSGTCVGTNSNSWFGLIDSTVATTNDVYIWQAQLVLGDQIKPDLETTDRLNMPRISWKNGEPFMLNEPERENLLLQSNNFNTSPFGLVGSPIITPNFDISPTGENNAWQITDSSTNYDGVQQGSIPIASGVSYTGSIFIKKTNTVLTAFPLFQFAVTLASVRLIIDTTNGTIVELGSPTNSGIEDYGDYWRVYISKVSDKTTAAYKFFPAGSTDGTTTSASAQGSAVIFGAQLEQGTYPTSYIPTLSTALTRNMDSPVYPSVAPYTEYTWFIDLDSIALAQGNQRLGVGRTGAAAINVPEIAIFQLGEQFISFYDYVNSTFIYTNSTILGRKKVCITFDGTSLKVYINGTIKSTYTPSINPITGNFYGLHDFFSAFYQEQKEIYKTFLTPTAITQAEAEKLTTL